MSFLRRLLIVASVELLALVAVSFAAGFGLACYSLLSPAIGGDRYSLAIVYLALVPIYAITIGAFAIFIFGAPAYAVLLHFKKARWWNALLLGVAPGLGLWVADDVYGHFGVAFGAPVALLTHYWIRRRQRRAEQAAAMNSHEGIVITTENINEWPAFKALLGSGKIVPDKHGRLRYVHGAPVGKMMLSGVHPDGAPRYKESAEEWFDPDSERARTFSWPE